MTYASRQGTTAETPGSLRRTLALFPILVVLLLSSCGGGGGGSDDDDEETDTRVELTGTILEPGGTATPQNPLGLQGAANRSISLYRVDDDGNVIGNVLETGTSDANGNYVLLLPTNFQFSSDLIVEAEIDPGPPAETARAIVLDETTDITPITEYITNKLIDSNLDMSNIPAEEVVDLIKFVESLPIPPQPDLSSMLVGIAAFSDVVVEAEIDDLESPPIPPRIRISGLLSVPDGTPRPGPQPRGPIIARPIPGNRVNIIRIDDPAANPGCNDGTELAFTDTDANGVFTLLLPAGETLSGNLMLCAEYMGQTVRRLVTDDLANIDANTEYASQQIFQTPDLDEGGVEIDNFETIYSLVYSFNVAEAGDLATTLDDIDDVAASAVGAELNNVIQLENVNAPVVTPAGPFNVDENLANTTLIHTVAATDADPVGTVTGFSIAAGNTNGAFAIAANGGITVVNSAALDRETTPAFTLTITATDGSKVSAGVNFVINLNDLNDTAPVITPGQSFDVADDATIVGTVAATDADTTGAVTSFSITGGNTGNAFAIAADGEITVDDNTSLLANSPYTLTITATDGTNPSAPETVGVVVTVTGPTGAVWDQFDWDDGSTWQ